MASSVTAGNLIVVGVGDFTSGATNVSSVTDNKSNTYTRITGVDGVGNGCTLELWYAYNVTGGAGLVATANFTVNSRCTIIAQEFSGILTTDPLDKSSSLFQTPGTGTTYTSTATAATTQADELVVGFVADANGGHTYVAGSGYSNMNNSGAGGTPSGMESKVVSSTGVQTATATVASGNDFYSFLVGTFKGGTAASTGNFLGLF